MIRRFILKGSLVALAAAGLISCSSNSKGQDDGTADARPKVQIQNVISESVPQIEEFSATVQANVKNNIAPSVPMMRIEKINVEVGDYVKKGQLLVQMENDNLLQQKLQFENLKVEFERAEALYKKGGTSKSEFDARKTQYEIAETSYNNLMENTELRAPVDGVISARHYDKGDLFAGQMPILTLEQIRPVKLYINVSETFYTYIKKGMPVDVTLDVYKDRKFNGKVSIVYPTVDPATRTFTVEVKLDNRDMLIKPGMFAKVMINFGSRDNVVVPDRAIVKQSGSGERFVYVYKDGKVSYNKVELGRRMDNRYEVLSGVQDGDQVVVVGQPRLNDGIEVMVVEK